jgi:hypothetical protein
MNKGDAKEARCRYPLLLFNTEGLYASETPGSRAMDSSVFYSASRNTYRIFDRFLNSFAF